MDSNFIKNSIKRKYPKSAFVPEISMKDDYYFQEYIRERKNRLAYYKRKGKVKEDHVTDENYNMFLGKEFRRIDLLMLTVSTWTAIEIKVSRADFFKDTYEKRKVWKDHTHRFVYATPVGLVTPEEVPEGCGLWEIDELGQIISKKNAKTNKERKEFPEAFLKTVFWRLSVKS